MVFDEWLEARGETLDCVALVGSDLQWEASAAHYEQQALLVRFESDDLDSPLNPVRGETEAMALV